MVGDKLTRFLNELEGIAWFSRCGVPSEKYRMERSLYRACDGWGQRYIEVWDPQIYALEELEDQLVAEEENDVDEVFELVSAAIGDRVWNAFWEFIKRCGLEEETGVIFELFDNVKRDAAWAGVEYLWGRPGFFTGLLGIYREGYFPCAWEGDYPSGRAVVM